MTRSTGLLVAVAVALLGLTGAALAGGPSPSLIAVAGRVWLASDSGVTETGPSSGRILRHPATPYPYPTGIGASDGWIWITSVTNGYTAAAITRIPFHPGDTGHGSITYPHRPILALAVGSGTTWLLLGPSDHLRLVAVDQATNTPRRGRTGVPVRHDLGWITADNTGTTPGLYGIAGTDLVRIRPNGTTAVVRRLHVQPSGHLIVANGSIFVSDREGISRINAATGRLAGRLALSIDGATLAYGDHTLWLLRSQAINATASHELLRIDPATMHATARRRMPGPTAALSYGDGLLWISAGNPARLVRVDPATLRPRVLRVIDSAGARPFDSGGTGTAPRKADVLLGPEKRGAMGTGHIRSAR